MTTSTAEIPKYLEKEDLASFLRMPHDAALGADYVIFMVLAYTGLRVGELYALKWPDIDFSNHTISVTKTYYNPKNNIRNYELRPPKTKTSRRIINVSQKVINELDLHKARQEKRKPEIKIYGTTNCSFLPWAIRSTL